MRKKYWALILAAMLLLTGCSMRTADQMYALPKRSERYVDLQKQIDSAMEGLSYCAPLSGENRQTVQMADLNGDGIQEYLVFAKGNSERPMRILIFAQDGGKIRLWDAVEGNGTAFEQVEYVDMDAVPGVELVVGCQLSEQLRSVSVYHFPENKSQRLLNTNYSKYMVVDLDADQKKELFVLRPGQSETDHGIAELYDIKNGAVQRSNEVSMSGSADKLKRVLAGKLNDGRLAVYAASAVDESSLITDVFTWMEGSLANISLSSESGTSVHTLRNYYVYAEDIDADGVVELPSLIPMLTFGENTDNQIHDLIRWYALQTDGREVDKKYTYHNFVDGWYMELKPDWASRLTVLQTGNEHEFYLWNNSFDAIQKIMTVTVLTGQDKESQSQKEGCILLARTDTAIFAATLESDSHNFGITRESIINSFHLIQQDWITS